MAVIFMAFGLVLIVEGLAWLLAPSLVEQVLDMLRALPEAARRQIGALAMVGGLILLWISHWLGPI